MSLISKLSGPMDMPLSLGNCDASRIPTLTTERLILRPYVIGDFKDACNLWANKNVVRFIGGTPRTASEVWTSMQRNFGSWALLGYGYWAITNRSDGIYLGEIGFLEGLRSVEPSISGTPEAGWCLTENAWGHGYATEALQSVLSWIDTKLVSQTVCIISLMNVASIKVATKCTYQLIDEIKFDGTTGIYRRTGLSVPTRSPISEIDQPRIEG